MMMVEMLDTPLATKLAREHIAAKLNNPKLESDCIPLVRGAIIHPPAKCVDLSQPRPPPPPDPRR